MQAGLPSQHEGRPVRGSRLLLAAGTLASAVPLGAAFSQDSPPDAAPILVVDGEGGGIEGAVVQVLRAPPADAALPHGALLIRTRTTSNGAMERGLPSVRGMTLVVDHPRYERFIGTFDDGRMPATIRLGPGRSLKGRVFFSDGREAARATVCVRWRDENAPFPTDAVRRCADTGNDGRFVVSGLSTFPEAEVVAEAEGHGRAARDIGGSPWPDQPILLRLPAEATGDEATVRQTSPGGVRVQVLSAAGVPVDRFTMRVLIKRARSHSTFAREVDQGTSPVVVPIPGDVGQADLVQIHFQAENHLLSGAYGLTPSPGRVVDLGVVYLEPGAVVTGRLFAAGGAEPIAGCVLELLPSGNAHLQYRLQGRQDITVSDGHGGFLLGGLSEGRYYVRTECRIGPPTARLIALDGSERADLGEIWMLAPRTVLVRAHGVTHGTVRVMDRFREMEAPLATANLQPTGRGNRDPSSFAVVQLASGRYRIDIRNSSDSLLVSKEIRVDAYDPADRIEVDLAYRNRTIRSILTLGGVPVNGGLVGFERVPGSRAGVGLLQINVQQGDTVTHSTTLRPGQAFLRQSRVAADGSFTVKGAPDEFLWMTWVAANGRSRVGRIWPDRPLSQFELGGTSVVSGELRPAAGHTLKQAHVALIGDLGLEVAGTSTAENGYFTLPPAPPGHYRLQADTGAGLAHTELTLKADLHPPFQALQVDEEALGEVEVRLATPDGPMVGAWIHVLGPDETLAAAGIVAEDGVLRADNVPPGEVTVLWNHGGACVGADKVTVEAARTAQLKRTLPLGRLLELRCLDRSCAGETLSLVRVTTEAGVKVAHHLPGALPGTTFSEDGRVGLGCLTPGAYTVSLWVDEHRLGAEFELDPGPEEVPVTVTLEPTPE